MKTRILHIFRHGETDWNRDGRMQGGTDIPLNETGRAQALELRKYFAKNPVEVFLSSDLSRAHETAKIAAGSNPVPIVLDPRLRETNLGDAEGLTQEQFIDKFGAAALEHWRHFPDHPDARFPNGETKVEHLSRVRAALEDFLSKTNHRHIGIATHGGSMRRLIHHWRDDLPSPVMVANCAVYRVEYDPVSGLWTIDI